MYKVVWDMGSHLARFPTSTLASIHDDQADLLLALWPLVMEIEIYVNVTLPLAF